MLVALILLVPVLGLVGITIWAFYRCRAQAMASTARPAHAVTVVKSGIGEVDLERNQPCLNLLDSYFDHGSMILGGRSGDWDLTRHLTQFRRRRWRSPESLLDRQHW